jgi:phosphate-selective porin OprO/OprP
MPDRRVPLRRILLSMDRRADFVAARRGPARSRRGVVLLAIGMLLFTSSLASSQSRDPEAKQTESGPPIVSAGEDGFVIQSPSGDYRLQFGVLLQVDGRFDPGDDDRELVDTFALRRVRPQLRGRIAQRFEFFLNPDFAGGTLVLQDAYVDTRFSPAFIVRLGKGKTPFGLERLTSAGTLVFVERGLPTLLVPNRDVGVQVFGEIPGGIVSYAAAVLNGVADGGSGDVDTNDGKDLVGRIVIRPFGPASTIADKPRPASGLTIAVAGTTGNQTGTLATIRTPSLLRTFLSYAGATADGRLNRYSPQASYYFKRLGAIAEYVHTNVPMRKATVRREISHEAWQIAGSFVLTRGDSVTEGGVRPLHNFDFGNGHLGALQVAARYHALFADEQVVALGLATAGSSREAKAWTLGLNWYLNPNFRYLLNFERIDFDASDIAARQAENAIAFRAQVNF